MAQSLPYPMHYLPQQQYYLPTHPQHVHMQGQMHLASTNIRQQPEQRKRPKYTRSKTGCLTCRMKKIKCDETKPMCNRCAHGQRECTWPDVAPSKKRGNVRKGSVADGEDRPSTAESSSHVSEASSTGSRDVTPLTRDVSAAERAMQAVGSERRNSEPFAHSFTHVSSLGAAAGRRQTVPNITPSHSPYVSQTSLGSVPELPPMYSQSQYPASYSLDNGSQSGVSSRHSSRPSTAHSLPSLPSISSTRYLSHSPETASLHYNAAPPPPMMHSVDLAHDAYVSAASNVASRSKGSWNMYQYSQSMHDPRREILSGARLSHDPRA